MDDAGEALKVMCAPTAAAPGGAGGQPSLRRALWAEVRPPVFDLALAAILLIGLACAFVGLASSSYFVDELFTLYVIDHHGGAGEVLKRALTDVWPPIYYLLLYGWSKLAGHSEIATRLPSAGFAVAALAAVALGLRRRFSPRALLFAAAVAVTGKFWFDQAQEARGYTLGVLISTGLLLFAVTLRARTQIRQSPWPSWAGLTVLALVGAFVHFYVALEAGLVIAFLILTTGGPRLKAALVGSGLASVVATGAYSAVLVGHTQWDIHHTWFGADMQFLVSQLVGAVNGICGPAVAVILAGLIAVGARRVVQSRRKGEDLQTILAPETAWATGLAIFVLLGMIALGFAISLTVAPSFSDRNLLIAAPMAWVLWAAIFELAAPRLDQAGGKLVAVAIVVVLGGTLALESEGRFLPRQENWRAAAGYVDSLKTCGGAEIPVVQTFGPPTPHFHALAEAELYGRYARAPRRLRAYPASAFGGRDRDPIEPATVGVPTPPTTAELAQARPDLIALLRARLAPDTDACPVLAWAVHRVTATDMENLRQAIARSAQVPAERMEVRWFPQYKLGLLGWRSHPEAYVLLARRP